MSETQKTADRREALAAVLAEHFLSSGGRNLGQYRTGWTCSCDALLVSGSPENGDRSFREVWNRHLATALTQEGARA